MPSAFPILVSNTVIHPVLRPMSGLAFPHSSFLVGVQVHSNMLETVSLLVAPLPSSWVRISCLLPRLLLVSSFQFHPSTLYTVVRVFVLNSDLIMGLPYSESSSGIPQPVWNNALQPAFMARRLLCRHSHQSLKVCRQQRGIAYGSALPQLECLSPCLPGRCLIIFDVLSHGFS